MTFLRSIIQKRLKNNAVSLFDPEICVETLNNNTTTEMSMLEKTY